MEKIKFIKKTLPLLVLALFFEACVSVKEYQKMALNHQDMQLSDPKVKTYEINFQSYREGASGANGGKSGGGCGCN